MTHSSIQMLMDEWLRDLPSFQPSAIFLATFIFFRSCICKIHRILTIQDLRETLRSLQATFGFCRTFKDQSRRSRRPQVCSLHKPSYSIASILLITWYIHFSVFKTSFGQNLPVTWSWGFAVLLSPYQAQPCVRLTLRDSVYLSRQ